jgi:hypothetical protein
MPDRGKPGMLQAKHKRLTYAGVLVSDVVPILGDLVPKQQIYKSLTTVKFQSNYCKTTRAIICLFF